MSGRLAHWVEELGAIGGRPSGGVTRVACGEEVVELTSGAGHDAMVLAPHVPAAMLFVPSRAGISHAPDEYTQMELFEPALTVLTETVAELAG